MPPPAVDSLVNVKCASCGTAFKEGSLCGSNLQDENYNKEIYPPILENKVDHDMPTEKVYGDSTPCPELIYDSSDLHLQPLVELWVSKFNAVLRDINQGFEKHTVEAEFDDLFANHVSWRDHYGLGWNFHTFSGLKGLKKRVIPRLYSVKLENIVLDNLADYRCRNGYGKVIMHSRTPEHPPIEWIQIYYSFNNKIGSGKGVARLAALRNPITQMGELKCFTFYTVLEDLKSCPERILHNRPVGVNHGVHKNRETWMEIREREMKYTETRQPKVLIVGGGQGGLCIAARLKSFGIDALILEKNHRVGDNWRNRYKSLVLHDPVWYDQMPYISFPPTWPVYTPKDKLGDWFDSYAKNLELNIKCDSTVKNASFDDVTKRWKVEVHDNITGVVTFFKPIHVVMATGHAGEPKIPKFEGQEEFRGEIVHSSQYSSATQYKKGKALVIGSCNSGHDICQNLYEQGVDVTMLQRTSTCIITSKHGTVNNNKGLYDEDGPCTETADRIFHSMPINLTNGIMQQQYRLSCQQDQQLLNKLKEAGFKLNSGYGGTGILGLYLRSGSGYCIDVGCSSLIIEGKVKLKSGVTIKRFLETGVEFSDGTKLDGLSLIVLATGYTNMKESAKKIFGKKVAERLKPTWGLDKEGEINTMWRESGHQNFWYMGGNLALCRYYSKRLALRIVSQELDIFY